MSRGFEVGEYLRMAMILAQEERRLFLVYLIGMALLEIESHQRRETAKK